MKICHCQTQICAGGIKKKKKKKKNQKKKKVGRKHKTSRPRDGMPNKCHCANRYAVGKSPITSVIGVAGNITNVEGECILPVKVGTLQLWQKFHILPGNTSPEIIWGGTLSL